MSRKKRSPQMGRSTQKHHLSTKHQQNVTRFQENQKPLNNTFDQLGNESHSAGRLVSSPVEKRRGFQTHFSPNKNYRYPSTTPASTPPPQSPQRKTDGRFILVGGVVFVFILWELVALYEQAFTGNGSLIEMGDKATPVMLLLMLLPSKKEEV